MKKGRTSANLEEGELEEDETISIGMVHGQKSSPKWEVKMDKRSWLPTSHLNTDLEIKNIGVLYDIKVVVSMDHKKLIFVKWF